MSTQQNFNDYYQQFILYYCNFVNNDPIIYDFNSLSNVCSITYDGINNMILISGWLISAYPQPSNSTLLSYVLSSVLNWFDWFYNKPQQITSSQPFKMSTSVLNSVRTDSSMIGYVVYDTTLKVRKVFNGTNWITSDTLYLPSNSDIDLTNHNINNVLRLNQSSPSIASVTSSSSAPISFTANVSQNISLPGFTSSALSSDWSLNTSTGRLTYSGITKNFQVSASYSVNTLIPVSTQTLTIYLSKNSAALNGPRNVQTFIILGLAYTYSSALNHILSFSNGDYIMLGGLYNATGNVTISNISYCISQI